MITSLLRYPKGDRYIQIHQSLLAATDGNACAAALLRFFEQFHRYKYEHREYQELYNVMAKEAGLGSILDTSGWQYHTYEQLRAGIMIYSEDAIRHALRLLITKSFLDTDVPERLRILHKTGRTQWFLLKADKLNEFLDSYELSVRPKKLVFPPPKSAAKKAIVADLPQGQNADMAMRIFEYKSKRRVAFWKARFNKDVRPLRADADTLGLIMGLLKLFKPEELAYAVEGNYASPHHAGQNDRHTVYDDIVRHVFKNVETVRRNIGYAEQYGVNFSQTSARFNGSEVKVDTDERRQTNYVALAKLAYPWVAGGVFVQSELLTAFENVRKQIPDFEPKILEGFVKTSCELGVGVYGEMHKEKLEELLNYGK